MGFDDIGTGSASCAIAARLTPGKIGERSPAINLVLTDRGGNTIKLFGLGE